MTTVVAAVFPTYFLEGVVGDAFSPERPGAVRPRDDDRARDRRRPRAAARRHRRLPGPQEAAADRLGRSWASCRPARCSSSIPATVGRRWSCSRWPTWGRRRASSSTMRSSRTSHGPRRWIVCRPAALRSATSGRAAPGSQPALDPEARLVRSARRHLSRAAGAALGGGLVARVHHPALAPDSRNRRAPRDGRGGRRSVAQGVPAASVGDVPRAPAGTARPCCSWWRSWSTTTGS